MVGGSSSSASVAEERDGLAKVVVSRAAVDMEMVLPVVNQLTLQFRHMMANMI